MEKVQMGLITVAKLRNSVPPQFLYHYLSVSSLLPSAWCRIPSLVFWSCSSSYENIIVLFCSRQTDWISMIAAAAAAEFLIDREKLTGGRVQWGSLFHVGTHKYFVPLASPNVIIVRREAFTGCNVSRVSLRSFTKWTLRLSQPDKSSKTNVFRSLLVFLSWLFHSEFLGLSKCDRLVETV